jgi:signal transduction histidine kinase
MTTRPDAEPQLELKNNFWLQIALGCLWIFAVWSAVQRLSDHADAFRLPLFVVTSAVYLLSICGIFSRYYNPRQYRGYFFHQFLLLSLLLWVGQPARNLWVLILPLSSQAILFLRGKRLILVLLGHAALAFIPVAGDQRQLLNTLIGYVSSFFFTAGCSYAIRREFESRKKLHDAHAQLRAYSEKAEALAIAEERARFAREIHDGVAHHLTAANVLVEAGLALLSTTTTPPAAVDSLQKGQGQIRSALAELRDSINNRPGAPTEQTLRERIETLITRGDFPATLRIEGVARRLPAEAEQALFRLAQEALTNARKHAPGAAIQLTLDFSDPARSIFSAENKEPAQTTSGDGAFGLLSLRERMQRLGGIFHAGPDGTGSFIVRAELPA